MNTHTLNTVRAIRKPQVAKRPFSRLTDGIEHPVTVVLAVNKPEEPAKG